MVKRYLVNIARGIKGRNIRFCPRLLDTSAENEERKQKK